MADIIQFRRDTLERWAEYNPTLAEGEIGFVLGSQNQYKVGDGVHAWNDLPLKGFNGNIVDGFASNDEEKDFDAVISQGGLSTIFKHIVSNESHIDISSDWTSLDEFNTISKCGFYVLTRGKAPCYLMLISSDNMGHGVYQWIFGNLQIDADGQIRGAHWDGRAHIIFRYKDRQNNTWGEWKYYQQGFLKDSLEEIQETGENNSLISPSIRCLNSEIEKINSRHDSFKNTITSIIENISKQLSDFNYKYKQEITQDLIPKFNELNNTVENMIQTMSETEYENLVIKDPNTVYLIYEDEE